MTHVEVFREWLRKNGEENFREEQVVSGQFYIEVLKIGNCWLNGTSYQKNNFRKPDLQWDGDRLNADFCQNTLFFMMDMVSIEYHIYPFGQRSQGLLWWGEKNLWDVGLRICTSGWGESTCSKDLQYIWTTDAHEWWTCGLQLHPSSPTESVHHGKTCFFYFILVIFINKRMYLLAVEI